MQARKDEARSHLSQVWSIDEVPDGVRERVNSPKVLAWLKASQQQAKRAAVIDVPFVAVLNPRRLYNVYDFVFEG